MLDPADFTTTIAVNVAAVAIVTALAEVDGQQAKPSSLAGEHKYQFQLAIWFRLVRGSALPLGRSSALPIDDLT